MIILVLQTFSRFSTAHHFWNHGSSLQHGRGGGRMWHYDGIQVFRAGRAGLAHRKMHTTASGSHICTVSKYEKKNLSWILNFATPSEYGSRMKKKSLSLCQIESRFFFPQLLMHHVSLHMSLNVLTLRGLIWSKRSLAQYQPKEFFTFYFDLRPPLKT